MTFTSAAEMTFTSAAVITLRALLTAQVSHAQLIERSLEAARTFGLSYDMFKSISVDADELYAIASCVRESLQTLGGYNAEAKRDFGIISDLQNYAWGSFMTQSESLWIPEKA